jgi:hypothetical protein
MNLLPDLLGLLAAIEQSIIGQRVRMAPYLYPVLESIHVLGIALLVGPAITVDLRLLGLGRKQISVTSVMRLLLPVSHIGFVLAAFTGLAMFCAIALSIVASPAAPWKLGLIVVAGINIIVFHAGIYRSVHLWDMDLMPPMRARIAGAISGCSWAGVIVAGRFLAY